MKRKYTDEQLVIAVKTSKSLQETLNILNLIGGHARIKQKIINMNLDTNHWSATIRKSFQKTPKLVDLLKENIFLSTTNLRKRLLNNGIFEYKCFMCGISNWQENYLSLQLDHINGIRTDNRLENLRLLCPNCHSQTDTYCGKNTKGKKRKNTHEYIKYPCVKCGTLLSSYQNKLHMCSKCRKTEYGGKLTKEQLNQLYIDYDSGQFTIKYICETYSISESTLYNLLKRRV